ncbi:MAG: type II secretion system protein GspK [Candidatus Omnitrophica bacterium]|nr:type II secretion system protein GspK [Candidatus Omnitrophota bacterium]
MPRRFNNYAGSILIFTLWTISVLSLFAVYTGSASRMHITAARRLEDRAALRDATESGAYDLADYVTSEYRRQSVLLFARFLTISNDQRYIRTVPFRYGSIESVLTDEDGKLNISTAPFVVFRNLFIQVVGLPENKAVELANNIIDWRDEDNERRGGLEITNNEDRYYRESGLPYTPRNALFEQLEELLLVKGMTLEIYQAAMPYLTAYGSGRININTCRREILECVGIPPLLVKKIMDFRTRHLAQEGQRPGIFHSSETVVQELEGIGPLDDSEKKLLGNLTKDGIIGVDSQCFRIRCTGNFFKEYAYIDCVFQPEKGIRYWHEGWGKPV